MRLRIARAIRRPVSRAASRGCLAELARAARGVSRRPRGRVRRDRRACRRPRAAGIARRAHRLLRHRPAPAPRRWRPGQRPCLPLSSRPCGVGERLNRPLDEHAERKPAGDGSERVLLGEGGELVLRLDGRLAGAVEDRGGVSVRALLRAWPAATLFLSVLRLASVIGS